MQAVLAISSGAALGALLRWVVAVRFNTVWALVPLGTLAVNLVGGYLMGFVVGIFAQHPSLPVELRLFLMTGFLGALTTFSAFSAEVMLQIQRGDLAAAMATVTLHVVGALLMTFAGLWSATLLR